MIYCLVRAVKNGIGRNKGFSNCLACGDYWNWKKAQDIPYAYHDPTDLSMVNAPVMVFSSQAMFPVCKECFQKLSFEAIMEYCEKLWRSWNSPGIFPYQTLAESIKAIKAGRDPSHRNES